MDYIVLAEDRPYYHWQLELLIESFKTLGIEDQLLIGFSKTGEDKIKDFTKNIINHERKVVYDDNIDSLISHFAFLDYALRNDLIKQPFVWLEPDMVLCKPILETKYKIQFHVNPKLTLDFFYENHCFTYESYCKFCENKNPDIATVEWLSVGGTLVFNDVPLDFFSRLTDWAARIVQTQKTPFNLSNRAAFAFTMLDFMGHLDYYGTYELEQSLLHPDVEYNIIHYEDGMLPIFHKDMFQLRPPTYVSFSGKFPFEVLEQNTPTRTTYFVANLIKQYNQ